MPKPKIEIEDVRMSASAFDEFFAECLPKRQASTGKTRIASVSQLVGFRMVASDTLVRVSQQDFWKLGEDKEGFFIERLVEDNEGPVQGLAPMDKLSRIARKVASGGSIRTAGKIEFVKDTGPIRRDIRVKNFEWTPESLRSLAKILWASQRAHSYAMSAYRLFSKMPSSEFSPDGLLGGRGYIQNIKDMRANLAAAVESISSFSDTIHDEVGADHWSPAEENAPSVQPVLDDAEIVKNNPDGFIEGQFDEVADGEFGVEDGEPDPEVENSDPDSMNPYVESEETTSDDSDTLSQVASRLAPKPVRKTKKPDDSPYSLSIDRILKSHQVKVASSSLPQSTLPGPRIEHIGPGETEEGFSSDDPMGDYLSSGVNVTIPLYEDEVADGVSGYDDPTSGDASLVKAASSYSLLPGSDNNKIMPIYDFGLSKEDVEYMLANSAPEIPGQQKRVQKPTLNEFWEDLDIR